VIAELLELADWRRQVSELYAAIRAEPDPATAWMHWREVRDRLFRTHPQSPVPEEERGDATTPAYHDYDPALRTVADVESADGATFELPDSTTGHVTAERAGTARFTLGGEPIGLSMFWLLDYAGGFFLSFRDANQRRRHLWSRSLPARHRQGGRSGCRREWPAAARFQLRLPAVVQLRPSLELSAAPARELAHDADSGRRTPPPLIRRGRESPPRSGAVPVPPRLAPGRR